MHPRPRPRPRVIKIWRGRVIDGLTVQYWRWCPDRRASRASRWRACRSPSVRVRPSASYRSRAGGRVHHPIDPRARVRCGAVRWRWDGRNPTHAARAPTHVRRRVGGAMVVVGSCGARRSETKLSCVCLARSAGQRARGGLIGWRGSAGTGSGGRADGVVVSAPARALTAGTTDGWIGSTTTDRVATTTHASPAAGFPGDSCVWSSCDLVVCIGGSCAADTYRIAAGRVVGACMMKLEYKLAS
jgi:hypothetical protein